MDPRLRAAVSASVGWYDGVLATHGVGSYVRDGVWRATSAPPPLHSAAIVVDPAAEESAVVAAVAGLEHCSVADPFLALDLAPIGWGLLFEASWLWRPPVGEGRRAAGWSVVSTPPALAEWNARHDTEGVLLPSLLGNPSFRLLARHEDGRLTAGLAASVGPDADVTMVSNVFFTDGGTDWEEVVAAASAELPGLPLVGYESGSEVPMAVAAGFEVVGTHRVWAR